MKNILPPGVFVPYKIIATFGQDYMRGNGKDEIRYHCPMCVSRRGKPDKQGKLYINIHSLKFNCFLCGYSGEVGKDVFIDQNRYYERTLDQDVEYLLKNFEEMQNQEDSKYKLRIPLRKIFDNNTATEYLIKRGFEESKLEYYDLRVGDTNYMFGRIIIPNEVKFLTKTDYFTGRSFIDQKPKYKNPTTEKSDIVFNLFRVEEGRPIIVTEGPLTAIAAGYQAVATLGKTMTRSQASQILKKKPSRVYVNYDYGAESWSKRACYLLSQISPETEIYEVLMKDERDAADLTHSEYAECLRNAVRYNPLYDKISNIIDLGKGESTSE